MKRIAVLAPIVLALALSAQTPPEKAPTITDAHRAEFFKRQLAFNQAAQAYQTAQGSLQTAVDAMNKECGERAAYWRFNRNVEGGKDKSSRQPICADCAGVRTADAVNQEASGYPRY